MIGDNVRNTENCVWPGDKGTYTYCRLKKCVVHSIQTEYGTSTLKSTHKYEPHTLTHIHTHTHTHNGEGILL